MIYSDLHREHPADSPEHFSFREPIERLVSHCCTEHREINIRHSSHALSVLSLEVPVALGMTCHWFSTIPSSVWAFHEWMYRMRDRSIHAVRYVIFRLCCLDQNPLGSGIAPRLLESLYLDICDARIIVQANSPMELAAYPMKLHSAEVGINSLFRSARGQGSGLA